jgi:prevent-host-death family protein
MVKTNPKTSTTVTSREFNQDTGRAKKAAADGPVFITDRGKPAHVLLSIDEYQRLTRTDKSILELMRVPELDEFADQDMDALDLELARMDRTLVSEERIEALVKDLSETAV